MRSIQVKAWGSAPGLSKSESTSAESAIHFRGEFDARIPLDAPKAFGVDFRRIEPWGAAPG
jgi:hypothetical protein